MTFQFIANPTGDGMSDADFLSSALEQPMSLASTLWDQAKGGAVESFGLGTLVRDAQLPTLLRGPELTFESNALNQAAQEQYAGKITESQYKASPDYREGVPWQEGMTRDRAAALADQFDRGKVREFYASKRPVTAFMGKLAGSATDPINYIPVFGEAVTAANVARFGKIGGRAITSALDASANTAIASVASAPIREQLGDDVSFQSTVSQIAMAAMVGGAFGAIHGRFGRAAPDELRADAETKLATLENVQKSRIALNDAIDGMVHDGEVDLSPASAGFVDDTIDDVSVNYADTDPAYAPLPKQPRRLAQFVKENGGVTDIGGDVRAILGGVKGRPGLVSKLGVDADEAAHAAQQAGYFPELSGERPTVRQFLDKLEQDLRGDPQYSVHDDTAARAYHDVLSRNEEIDRFSSELGIDAKGMSRAEFWDSVSDHLSVERMAEEEQSRSESARSYFEDAEKQAKEWLAGRGDAWEPDKFYDLGAPRTLEDLNNEFRQGATSGNAPEGPRGPQQGRSSRSYQRQIQEGLGSRGNGARHAAGALSQGRADESVGLAEAAKRVGKPASSRDLAEQYRVNPETGDFPEAGEIEQLKAEGRITPEDQAMLDEAEETLKTANGYAEALKAFANCVI